MKRLLSIIGAISLVGTSTTSLVACNKTHEYTPEELAKLKEENKINTKDQTVRDNLEWIAAQEKPFNTVDNKWYYVVWKGKNWNNTKIKNDQEIITPPKWEYRYKDLDIKKEYKLQLRYYSRNNTTIDLIIFKSINDPSLIWKKDTNNFKVYRWNLDITEPNLVVDNDGNIKVDGE
ncbi:lipoprotein [Spiroplasma endosymbiont of Glossina fuscipes fuscipes]|uniref:lipoprotein n=1 Tax=Spiroplasma endosymbiont of Glossina fuscipes fuscipes TaxID=2004463 RepID=UPI003CF7061A